MMNDGNLTVEDYARQLVALADDPDDYEVVEKEDDVFTRHEQYREDVCDAFYHITGTRLGENMSFYA